MRVYLLWHVSHADDEDGRSRHAEMLSGDWSSDEQAGDDVKLLGVYSTRDLASARIETARALPGFSDEPECFLASAYDVDRDEWTTGYVTLSD